MVGRLLDWSGCRANLANLQVHKRLKQLNFLADSFPTLHEPDFADIAFSVYLRKYYAVRSKTLMDKQQWLFLYEDMGPPGSNPRVQTPRATWYPSRHSDFWRKNIFPFPDSLPFPELLCMEHILPAIFPDRHVLQPTACRDSQAKKG